MSKKNHNWFIKGVGWLVAGAISVAGFLGMALSRNAPHVLGKLSSDAASSIARSTDNLVGDVGVAASKAARRSAYLATCPYEDTNTPTFKVDTSIIAEPFLNIRQLPNPNARVVGKIRAGHYQLDILSIENCWVNIGFVSTDGRYARGYVSGRYAKLGKQ